MKEFIERAAALDICQKEYEERLRMADYCGDTVAWNISGAIKSIPAADVVEVVRCKNCRFFSGRQECYCHAADENGTPIFVREDDFCSYGARMDKEDEHEAD